MVVRNDGTTDGCPSRGRILGTFALINVIVGLFSVMAGHRQIVQKITFGLFGKKGSKAYNYMWLLTVGLNLSASAANAFIMKNTEGYGERFNVPQIMLFYTTRPRITWIFAGLLTTPFAKQREKGDHWSENWVSFAYSQVFAEIFLQAIGIYTFVSANVYRRQQESQDIDTAYASLSHMKIGLVETLVGSFGWIIMFGAVVMMLLAVFALHKWTVRQIRDWCFSAVVLTLVCNWLFWDGYLREFPTEYCPPKLTIQGVVWVVFTAVGIPLGVGF